MIQMPPGQHQEYQQQLAKEAKLGNGHARKESFAGWDTKQAGSTSGSK
jgi:hypothetical protein